MIKLLSIIETLGKGGAERVLVNTLPELQELGIACEVAILFDREDLAEELEKKGIKVHRLHLSYKWNVIEGAFKMNQLFNKSHYDIVHAHLFFAYFYTGLTSIFNSGIRSVTTFHNLGYNTYPANTLWKKVRKKLDAYVVNRLIDNRVAVSNAVKEHYSFHLGIEQLDLIYNAFPLQSINSTLGQSRSKVLKHYVDINPFNYFSITPGRLVKEKGHLYLIEAIEQVNQRIKGLCHFIVGAGPLDEKIRNRIIEKQLKNVFVIPGLEQKQLFELIKACDFVVIPSVSEGFGMVVGEAMALQKPIITTKIDGILDLVEDEMEALLVLAEDSKSLAQSIERLYLDKDLRNELAKNAQEKIKQFDTRIIAKQWKSYYERMLNG